MNRNIDWVVMGGTADPSEAAFCQRCGNGLILHLPMDVMEFVARCKTFVDAHAKCVDVNRKEPVVITPAEWARGRDVGQSSATIYFVMTGTPLFGNFGTPRDAADFGRCYRLLKLFPPWKKNLDKVSSMFPDWTEIVTHWDELVELYEKEEYSLLNDQLKKFANRRAHNKSIYKTEKEKT